MTAIIPERANYDIYDICEFIVDLVEEEKTIPLLMDESLLKTSAGKIQFLATALKKQYTTPNDAYGYPPPLVNLKRDEAQIGIVQKLVKIILSCPKPSPRRSRAILALNCLQKIDPMLEPINYRVDLALNRVNKAGFSALRACTQLIVASEHTTALSVSCPTKPYPLPSHMPAYFRHYLTPRVRNLQGNPNIHDRFWRIKRVIVGVEKSQICTGNLVEIGKRENFAVHRGPDNASYKWMRDVVLFTHTGKSLLPSRFVYNATTATIVPRMTGDLYTGTMGWTAEDGTTEALLKSEAFMDVEEVPFFFEGGNLPSGINTQGKLFYASGGQNLLYSFLNSQVTLHGREEQLLKIMYSLEGTPLFSKERVALVRKRLADSWFLFAFPKPKEQEQIGKLSIAAIELIKEMMTEKLEAPVLFLGDPFESQPEFHLDMFLAFAPDGHAFIHSDEAAYRLVREVYQTHYKKLRPAERERLKLYFDLAKFNHKRNKQKYAAIEAELKQANFKVVRVPAIFYQEPQVSPVVFLNALFGLSEKDGAYCISNGSLDTVDQYLREAFVARMQSHGINRVYFTGRPSRGPISSRGQLEYAQAHRGLVKDTGGIHCRTLEENALQMASKPTPKVDLPPAESVSLSLPKFFRKMLDLLNPSTPQKPNYSLI